MVALLACALIWAQVVGVLHRLQHMGGFTTPHASVLFGQVGAGHGQGMEATPGAPQHSCVLFDGLCMADGLATALPPLVAIPQVRAAPHDTAFASWQASFARHFQPRGPPAA